MIAISTALAMLAQAPTTPVDAERAALAREVAAHSPLAVIGPLQTAAEVEQIIADATDLSFAEKDRLREIGRERAAALGEKALTAEAQALADTLSIDDLRAIAAFNRSSAAEHHRNALPYVAGTTMQALGTIDYKGEVRAAFCAESGKLCEPAEAGAPD